MVAETIALPSPKQVAPKHIHPYHTSRFRDSRSENSFASTATPALAQDIGHVVAEESPIHYDEVQRVLATFYGTRASKRVQEACDAALALAIQHGLVRQNGAFLWTPEMNTPSVRCRGDTCPVTKPELIAPEEFQEAVKAVLSEQFGLHQDALLVSTSRFLGYRRRGAQLDTAVLNAIHQLLTEHTIVFDHEDFLKIRS